MRSLRQISPLLILAVAVLGLAPFASAQPPGTATGVKPAVFGQPFPLGTYVNLNTQAGGAERIDLAESVGKKPVLLYYWIAGNARADEMFLELQAIADEYGSDKLALYGVAMQRPGREAHVIVAKLAELQIKVPVLDDKGFRIGQQLRVQSVPNISILDAQGALRLTNGAALTQDLEYKMTVETAVRRVAERGSLSTYGFLARYYPVKEMIGKQCPDFEAEMLSTGARQSWYSMLSADKVNVLIFWSIDCPHCRTQLPDINKWIAANGDGVNVVSVARAPNDATKIKTQEFCASNGFVFPTLVDPGQEVSELFHVNSTPTSIVIRPDGVVDSVLLSSTQDFGKAIEEKKQDLLGAAN